MREWKKVKGMECEKDMGGEGLESKLGSLGV